MFLFRRKRWLGISAALFAFLMVLLHACMPSFRMSRKEIDAFFSSKNIEAHQEKYRTGTHEIHYVSAGDQANPLVLFVHGSPGSLSAFIDFLADTSLLRHTFMITSDRPGFGHSDFGHAEPSLLKQATALKPILEKYKNNRPRILVGHSLGGPLIARMAIEFPELVDGLIIVAGSVDPELEPNEAWFRAPLATPFLSWILPRSLRSSNEEIYQLKPELEKMLPYWRNITCPVIVIQGTKDELVPYENINFLKKELVNAPVSYVIKENTNHFIPWSDPQLIRDAILTMTKQNNTVTLPH